VEDIKQFLNKPLLKLLLLASLLGLFLSALYMVRSILTSFLIAFFLAFLLDPVVDFFERHKIPRVFGIIITVFLILLVFSLVILYVVPSVYYEMKGLAQNIPQYRQLLNTSILPHLDLVAGFNIEEFYRKVIEQYDLGKPLQSLSLKIISPIPKYLKATFQNAFDLVIFLASFFIIPILGLYLVKDIDRIKAQVKLAIPVPYRPWVVAMYREIYQVISNFLRGQIMVCFLLGTIYSVGLLLLHIPLALIIGMFAGLAALIPYFGMAVGMVSALLLAILHYHDFWHPLGVIGVFVLAQMMEGTIITPKIVGDKVGLHPVLIVLALMIWGRFLGFFGIVIAVPATAVLNVFWRHAMIRYKQSDLYLGKKEPSLLVVKSHSKDN
jgi:predicted PurR-regulated permease PerM